jgi:hypothetical protein
VSAAAKLWAKRQLLAELRELALIGHACNVQTWAADGRTKTNARLCAARRREAGRLLRVAISAVLNSKGAR